MSLLLDIGNTRIKYARLQDDGLSEIRAVAHHGDPAAALLARDDIDAETVWIASVFGEDRTRGLSAKLASRWQRTRHARSEPTRKGLHNAYAEPQRLGVDRWLAMLALWAESPTPFCTVSAGTALTLDLVDGRGRHLGGYIAPGLSGMQRAVLGSTRFEHRDLSEPYRGQPGQDTEGCVREAALAAVLGLIERSTRNFEGRLAITGGDADTLRPFLDARWQLRQDLVLAGLAQLARES